LDDHLKPVEVPPVLPLSADEKRRYNEAEERRLIRLNQKR